MRSARDETRVPIGPAAPDESACGPLADFVKSRLLRRCWRTCPVAYQALTAIRAMMVKNNAQRMVAGSASQSGIIVASRTVVSKFIRPQDCATL